MAHGLERTLTGPAVALRRQAAQLQPVFEKSLRNAKAILRQLPLLSLATLLSVIYLCSRGVRAAFALFRRLAARPPAERAALLAALLGLSAGTVWLALPDRAAPVPEAAAPVAVTQVRVAPVHVAPVHVAEHQETAHGGHPSAHAEQLEEDNKAAAEGVTLTVTLTEAIAHQIGESLSFFELGGKINEIFTPLKKGDTDTAMSKGAGAVTEYSLAAWLVDSLEIMALIASGAAFEAALGVAGSVAIVRSSVFVGEQVEEKTHASLSGGHEAGHGGGNHAPAAPGHGEQTAQK